MKNLQIGRVEYNADSDTISFYEDVNDASEDYFYWLPVKQLRTQTGYEDWMRQMYSKTWFVSDIRVAFLQMLDALGVMEHEEIAIT